MSTSSKKQLDIAIVSGSLAGLFAGVALRRLGNDITIFERSPILLLHDQGAGTVAGKEAKSFLARHDITRGEYAVTSKKRLYLTRAGAVIQKEDSEERTTSWDPVHHILRANFDEIENEYLDGAKAPKRKFDEANGTYE